MADEPREPTPTPSTGLRPEGEPRPADAGLRPEGEPRPADAGLRPEGWGPEPEPSPGGVALPRARRRPRAPDHRPPWLVLLSSLTLMYGGFLLVSSLETLRDPHAQAHLPVTRALTPAEDEIARQLADVSARVTTAHVRSIQGNAAASLPVALLMLFAAAATLSRDRRGRDVALAAAWIGIAYQVGTLVLTLPIVRDYATQASPLLARLVALQAVPSDVAATPELLAKLVMALPVVTAAVAIAISFVLIRYFGGRRGRVLYGLERPRP